jgi:class 3 adenylate cyclase/WD40 repeat protein/energy-coupling factor transporter ATP-binding protein EcfA2
MSNRRIADRYEPIEVVGRGGEATVMKAVDTRHGRLVALKMRTLPADGSDELLAEARTLLSLPPHPGLVHARDDFFDAGRHVLVLDWVDGVDLGRVVAESGRPGLPVSSVLRWMAQASEALTVLHQHQVTHGDVKPANLILTRSGRVVLVDLGSSSIPSSAGPRGGTPGFRAPEVAGGAPPSPASDVYSMAATAFALVTGAPPTSGPPSWTGLPAEVSSRLEAALRAGLSIDPGRRPDTPGALVERLRAGWDDATPTGVSTVMLTGLLGASQLWEESPHQAPALLAAVELMVDRAVEEHGGRRVGATVEGDTTCSTFVTAAAAVRAAVALQRLVGASDVAVGLRIGMATGELGVNGTDVLGRTVNRAARVRDLARSGEILLSGTTAELVRPACPTGTSLLALGPHRLHEVDGVDDIAAVVAEGAVAPPDPARSPYPGLAPFTPADADLYVGREETLERAVELLEENRFVAVVGASGSGKTSLALAGVVPRRGGAVVVRPGSDPLRALGEVAHGATSETTLVVDQLEELFTLCSDEAARATFVDAVMAHPGGVVVTVRADLYGELGRYAELARRVAESHVLLGPLGADEVIRAVEEPAARCGLHVERGLAEVIATELGSAPGALPLLGHALRETWRRRDGRAITLAGYRAAGGVASAIAATADRALAALDARQQQAARHLLLRMVELRTDGDDARRWSDRRELVEIEPEHGPGVIASLVDARLLVVDGGEVTIVHEALLRAWPTLHEWVTAERADLLVRQEIRAAATRWQLGGRADADLYRGSRLDTAMRIAESSRLPATEAEFVDAGRRLRDLEMANQRRRTRRLRTLAATASVMAVIAIGVGTVAVVQRNDAQQARIAADREASRADEAAAAAERGQAAAEASARGAKIEALVGRAESIRATQRDTSALLAAQAFLLADTSTTRSALLSTFTADQGFLDARRLDSIASAEGGSGIVLPDGKTAFVTGADGRLRPYDLDTGATGSPMLGIGGPPDSQPALVAPADGSLVAQLSWHGQVLDGAYSRLGIFDTASGRQRFAPVTVAGGASGVTFAAGGTRLVAAVYPDIHVVAYDTATGESVGTAPGLEVPDGVWLPAAITTAGDAVVVSADRPRPVPWAPAGVGGPPSALRVFDELTLELRRTVELPEGTAGRLHPVDDATVIAAGRIGIARVDITSGEVLWYRPAEFSCQTAVAAVARGSLYCADPSGRIDVRDLATGLVVGRLNAQNGNAGGLWFASGGRELVAFGVNESVVSRWRLDGSGPITNLIAPGYDPVAFSPNGDLLIVERGEPGVDYASRVVSTSNGGFVRDLGGLLGPGWIDDDTIGGAGIRPDGAAELAHLDLGVGSTVFDGVVFDPLPSYAETTPGKRATLLRYDGPEGAEVRTLWPDARRLGPLFEVGLVHVVSIDRDGTLIAASTADGRGIVFHDAATGAVIERFPGATRNAFITQADQLFVSSLGGELTQYDLATFEPVRTFGGSRGQIRRLTGTDDGSLIAVNGADRSAALFDVATGVRLGTPLEIPEGSLNDALLAPSGSSFALSGEKGVLLWDLEPSRWVDAACRVAGRNLTRAEWETNIGDLAPFGATCPEFPLP